jgi:hypothetical protein
MVNSKRQHLLRKNFARKKIKKYTAWASSYNYFAAGKMAEG